MNLHLQLRMEVRRLEGGAGYEVGYVIDSKFVPIVDITGDNRVLLHGTKLQIPDDWATDSRYLVQRWIAHETLAEFKREEAACEQAHEVGGES